MSISKHTFAVILAGGGGTRLWPKSRIKTPKQFLQLTGNQTMVQTTVNRIRKLVPWERIIVVTNELYTDDIKKQLPKIPQENVICEPRKRETALAMLVGSLYAKSKDPKAVIMNAASDHVVEDNQEFFRVMTQAVKVAENNDYLVTIGITPTEPNTGFGYIRVGRDLKKLNQGLSLFKVDSFTEKPNKPTALGYLSTGKYFWNANMYVWSAVNIKKAFKKHMPGMYKLTAKLDQLENDEFHQALPDIYQQAEKISIDYAISEKADNLVLIPGDFGWNDVGYWKVVYDLNEKNPEGNVIVNDKDETHILAINSKDNLIHTNNRLIALLDVNDLVVIDTDEILLIAPKNKSQQVKKIVEQLKKKGKEKYL